MQGMNLFHKILILLFGVAISVHAVPPVLNYAGQVAVNGEAFDGSMACSNLLSLMPMARPPIGATTEQVWTDRNLRLPLPFL